MAHVVQHDAPDAQIVVAAQNGSIAAFSLLVERHQTSIFRFLCIRCTTTELAEDLTQMTFVAAFERLRQLRKPTAFRSWLFQIAYRQWQMHLRQRANAGIISNDEDKLRVDQAKHFVYHEIAIERLEQRQLIQDIFRSLSASLRDALWLRHIAGFSDIEIASALGITPASAQKRAYRAEVLFRKRYDLAWNKDVDEESGQRISEPPMSTQQAKS